MQASFSPNRQFVVTASDDQTAIIWDAQTGKQRTILRGHLGPVRAAAFSPDGRRVATASLDHTIRIWDTQNGDELIAIKEPIGEAQNALPLAATRLAGTNPIPPPPARLPVVFSPDGLRFAAATRNGVAWVYDVENKREIASFKDHVGEVYGISFVPNGNQIVTTGADRTIRLWDLNTKQQLARSVQSGDEHTNRIYNAAISPDGIQVVTVGDDDTPRLWNASTGSLKAVLRGHQGSGYGAAFSPDGKRIATTAHDDTVRIWDTEAGKTVAVLEHVGKVWSVAFSSDGEWIITASDDHIAQVWPIVSTLQRLVDKSKATVPRCLDHKQREDAFLDAMPPKWCVEQKKWPIGFVAK
jgi:WD40 repeat protein